MNLSDITPDQAAELMRAAFGSAIHFIESYLNPTNRFLTMSGAIQEEDVRFLTLVLYTEGTIAGYTSDGVPIIAHPFNAFAVVDLLRSWGIKLEN